MCAQCNCARNLSFLPSFCRFTCRPCTLPAPRRAQVYLANLPQIKSIPVPYPAVFKHGAFRHDDWAFILSAQQECEGKREKMKEHSLLVWYLAMGAMIPMAGCARTGRSPTHSRRRLLMQERTRTAADEWEASSRQGILEIGTETESAREGPHPLRTADWKLEVSRFVTM